MSEVFDLKRFCRYARMHNTGGAKNYLGRLIGAFVLIVVLCLQFKFDGSNFGAGYVNTFRDVQGDFIRAYMVSFLATLAAFATLSLKGYRASNLSMKDVLMPISTFERYLFAVLTSTVVCFVVFNLIFWAASSYAESLFYFSEDSLWCSFRGLLGNSSLPLDPSYTQRDIFSFRALAEHFISGKDGSYIFVWFAIYGSLGFISAIMWGLVSFAKGGEMYTFLIHIALLVALSYGSYLMQQWATDVQYTTYNGLYFWSNLHNPSIHWVHMAAIPTILYQWVVWRKLKSLSPKN